LVAILVAIAVFASPLNLTLINRTGGQNAPPPAVQTELLYIDLVKGALIAASTIGATYLFLNAVVLA
jgi:hypothetical protein